MTHPKVEEMFHNTVSTLGQRLRRCPNVNSVFFRHLPLKLSVTRAIPGHHILLISPTVHGKCLHLYRWDHASPHIHAQWSIVFSTSGTQARFNFVIILNIFSEVTPIQKNM